MGQPTSDSVKNSEQVLVFQMEIPIRWGDMDAMGHVNNTVYFRYMEQVRISWFERLGMQPEPGGLGFVIVNAACSFLRQFEYPGTVLARQYVGEVGRSSVMTHVDMSLTDEPETVRARGSAKVVLIDTVRQKSAPLSEAMREMVRRPWRDG